MLEMTAADYLAVIQVQFLPTVLPNEKQLEQHSECTRIHCTTGAIDGQNEKQVARPREGSNEAANTPSPSGQNPTSRDRSIVHPRCEDVRMHSSSASLTIAAVDGAMES